VDGQAVFLDGFRGLVVGSVVGVLEFDGWLVAAPAVESASVVPVDPFEDLELDVFEGAPGSQSVDDFGLEEPVEGLCRPLGYADPGGV